jgi:hypothetical protein
MAPLLPLADPPNPTPVARSLAGPRPGCLANTLRRGGGMDLQARAILNQEAAAVRSVGKEPDARTIWLRLMDRAAGEGGGQKLLAATKLAGLATGLRPSGFEQASERPPEGGIIPG